jgi:hypothetical protein
MKILEKYKDQFFEELIEVMLFKQYQTYIILLLPN